MILFEANAVAPLVKLPDAAVEEIVQRDDLANGAKRKAPPLQKPQEWGTQLQRLNFKNPSSKANRTAGPVKRAAYHGF
jgi:hypothetical protein